MSSELYEFMVYSRNDNQFCQNLTGQVIDLIEKAYPDATIQYIDIDEHPECISFNGGFIYYFPTVVVNDNGNEIGFFEPNEYKFDIKDFDIFLESLR